MPTRSIQLTYFISHKCQIINLHDCLLLNACPVEAMFHPSEVLMLNAKFIMLLLILVHYFC